MTGTSPKAQCENDASRCRQAILSEVVIPQKLHHAEEVSGDSTNQVTKKSSMFEDSDSLGEQG